MTHFGARCACVFFVIGLRSAFWRKILLLKSLMMSILESHKKEYKQCEKKYLKALSKDVSKS